jgi:hypothetical protein
MVHIGDGLESAGLVHVANAVAVILPAAENDIRIGQAYHASNDSSVTGSLLLHRQVGFHLYSIGIPARLC